ncbi:MAG: hypothetical protein QM811_18845 [Pirellulales bacterium]
MSYQTIKALCLQQIEDLRANPKPTYTLDGQRVAWETYVRALQQTIDWCDTKLLEESPYEVSSVART